MTRHILALTAAIALFLVPQIAVGQQTIEAGMTQAEVRSLLGGPATVREQGAWTYMFYLNNCLPRCGSDDVVFLRDNRVVAAVFRTPARRFRGPAADQAIAGAGPDRPVAAPTEEEESRLRGDPTEDESEVRGIRLRARDD